MIIKYFAWLKNITNVEEEIIEDPSIVNIKTLKKYLSLKYPKLDKFLKEKELIRFAINLEYTSKNENINSDDEIALFPPVSGG